MVGKSTAEGEGPGTTASQRAGRPPGRDTDAPGTPASPPGSGDPGPGSPAGGGGKAGEPERSRGSRLGWIALGVTGLLAVWHVIYFVNLASVTTERQDVFISVFLFVSIVLAVASAVLGIVALSQKALPRWPATASLSVGIYAFLIVVASWLGGIMAAGT